MKILLDNNLSPNLKIAFKGQVLHVKDILNSETSDVQILNWAIKNMIDFIVTKDKIFCSQIVLANCDVKVLKCVFGNLSTRDSINLLKKCNSKLSFYKKQTQKLFEVKISD